MSATKNTSLRNKMADNFGSLFNSGTIEIRASDETVLVTFPLHTTAFQASANGTIQAHASSLTTQAASAGGTAHHAVLKSSDTLDQLENLTVGVSTAHVIINNTSIAQGQDVTLLAIGWTEPIGIAAA